MRWCRCCATSSCVDDEPATGPWYGVRYSETTFGIFETFPSIAGRQAHVDGGGGDIFRDLERMNAILASPAHVRKMDVLLSKQSSRGEAQANRRPVHDHPHLPEG